MPDTQSKIAEMLKTQRLQLGLSIDQIFEQTRINPEFLNALETGDFDELPKAYIGLFLKTYAREVGLDPDEVLAEYEKTIAPPPRETPTPPPPSHRKSNMAPVMLFAIGLIIVVIIALNLGEQNDIAAPLDTTATTRQTPVESAPQKKATAQVPQPETPPQTETQTITPTQSPAEPPTIQIAEQMTTPAENDRQPTILSTDDVEISLSQNQEPSPPPAETPETPQLPETNTPPQTQTPEPTVLTSYALPMPVVLADEEIMTLSGFVRETTHLAVSADGRQLFSGIIQAGSQRRWQAHDRFQLQVERAGAIALSLQDQPLESASPPDRSLRLVVSRTLIRVEELGDTPSDR